MTFLVCHNLELLSDIDLLDANLGELLAVAIALLEALTADLFEYKDFVSPYVIGNNDSLHRCAFHIGRTYLDTCLVLNEKHFVEGDLCVFCRRKTVAEELAASLNFELLACNVYDCVHYNKNFFSFGYKRRPLKVDLILLDNHQILGRQK